MSVKKEKVPSIADEVAELALASLEENWANPEAIDAKRVQGPSPAGKVAIKDWSLNDDLTEKVK